VQAGERDEEVLGEQLAAADDQEDEADAEAERAEDVRGMLAEVVLELRRDHREQDDAGDDVEARGERRRHLLEHRTREAALALFLRPLVDRLRLGDQLVIRFCAAHSQNSFWLSPI
jgi:hypothetical protein